MDVQPHWVSALAWPEEGPVASWAGDTLEVLLVGRMDGSLGLIEVVDSCTMHRVELEHCYRKDGKCPYWDLSVFASLQLLPKLCF